MISFRTSPRRLLAVAAAALIGAATALVLAAPASAEPTLTLEGTVSCLPDGSHHVNWSLYNGNQLDAKITKVEPTPTDSTVTGFAVGDTVGEDSTDNGAQDVPPGVNTASLKIEVEFQAIEGQNPTETVETTVPTEKVCIKYYTVESTCDGLVITMTNDAAATQASKLTFTLTPSNGSPQTVDVNSGETKKVTFTGPDGFTVKVQIGEFSKTYTWTKPRDCPTPTPTLPTTGTNVTGVVGWGAGLVIGGAALLFLLVLMRRRRASTEA